MKNYEPVASEIFAPLTEKFGLQFAALDSDEFFLIGHGFALWVFIEPKDFRSDVWYVSADKNGAVLTYTLMYLQKERFDPNNSVIYGKPSTCEECIEANLRVDASWLESKFQDILNGDKTWLQGYPDKGDYSRHVARFLKPYFEEQGYYIAPVPESYNT